MREEGENRWLPASVCIEGFSGVWGAFLKLEIKDQNNKSHQISPPQTLGNFFISVIILPLDVSMSSIQAAYKYFFLVDVSETKKIAEAFSLFDKHCHQNAAEEFFGGKPSAKVWLKEGERDGTHQRRSGKYKHTLGTEGVRSSALGNKGAHMWIPSRVCSAVERHKNRLADVNTHKQDWREHLSICPVTNSVLRR